MEDSRDLLLHKVKVHDDSDNSIFIKTFQIETSNEKVYRIMVSEAIPQVHTWPCALVLSSYIASRSELFVGKQILEIGAGIKLKEDAEESIQEQAQSDENSSWDSIDLISLESEVFLLGIWKDYQELEESLCMEELSEILNAKRENDYNEKKFLAAMQGIDLDEQTGNKKKNAWEEMKARVFSNNKTSDPDDILSLSGPAARKAGFGIGNGIGYEKWD